MAQTFTADELKTNEAPPYTETRRVRFQDVDAAGVVFYPRILEYFSDAYFSFLHEGGFDVASELEGGGASYPLVHAEADYLRPLRFNDLIAVEIAGAKLGETSYTIGYRVRTGSGKLAAIGQTAHVCIDRGTFKSRPIPESLRAVLT